jgi:hypothetical protein
MKQGSAFPYISYAVVRSARIGFSLMTHCICHERGTRFNAVPGSTPNTMDIWEGGLLATGGALEPEKPCWYLIRFYWKNGQWAYVSK